MKSISSNKRFFNQLRRKAKTMHRPLPEDYLNAVTARIKRGDDLKELDSRLAKAPVWRKVRLASALNFRLTSPESVVYQVRSGRGWAAGFFSSTDPVKTRSALNRVLRSIGEGMDVVGKVFHIPEEVYYALPATEKQFVGNVPNGSYVTVSKDMVFGIHWKDVKRHRIDLDLSLVGVGKKIGWDAYYRSDDILFSGDMTSAPGKNGASELFHVKKTLPEPHLLMLNYYNFEEDVPVDCKVFVASEDIQNMKQNYMVDINNIIASSTVKIDKKQNVLGLIRYIGEEGRFYFTNISVGNAISSKANTGADHAREFLINKSTNPIGLRDVLEIAGATVVHERPEEGEFVDLSPEVIDKATFVDLLSA
jgi:hypothetical protein